MRAWHGLIVLGLAVCASEAQAASQVGGGEGYTCAMGPNGRAFCWGINTSAQMGSGVGAPAQLSVGRPTEMAGGFVTVSNGAFHSCGLQADGLAYCWGDNYHGQLGIGSTQNYKSLPSMVRGPAFTAISAGGAHTCAIDTASQVWCWGWNGSHQLARFKQLTPFSEVPIQISTNTSNQVLRARAISAGDEHTCAIDMSGAAWCWGQNLNARAGIDINICGGGTTTLCEFARPNLTIASGASFNLRFTAISAGRLNTCGIDTTGTVQCWGTHFRGSALTGSADAPAAVGIGAAVSVSAGGQSTCAVASSGELFCWGNHENGELGDGTPAAPGAGSITPVRVAGAQDYSSVSVGGTHACARTNGGGARCWGGNTKSELGMSGMGGAKVSAPMTVMGLQSDAIMSGHNHVCSRDSANVIACWGDNCLRASRSWPHDPRTARVRRADSGRALLRCAAARTVSASQRDPGGALDHDAAAQTIRGRDAVHGPRGRRTARVCAQQRRHRVLLGAGYRRSGRQRQKEHFRVSLRQGRWEQRRHLLRPQPHDRFAQ